MHVGKSQTLKPQFLQDYPFESKEWQAHYTSDRNTIEGMNGRLKSEGISFSDAAKRRLRGYTAQYLCLTMQVMKENLRLIEQWGKERTEHESVEAREKKEDPRETGGLLRSLGFSQ